LLLECFLMRPSMRLLRSLLVLLLSSATFAQTTSVSQSPKRGSDGVYEVDASELQKLDSSPKVEFPRELAAYELVDRVVIALTVSPEGRVEKTKVVSGRVGELKEAVNKAVKKWAFQPHFVNGTPVPVRTEIAFDFDNTLDHYRESNGNTPVHLDEKVSHTLIIKSVPPVYPPDARAGRIQGSVELRVIVGEDGRVHALHIIKGHPMLAPAAYNAVRQWEFKPYVENGKTLPFDTNMTVNFTRAN
jgi:TonB family protein